MAYFWQLSAYGFIEGPTQSTITRMKVNCSDKKQTHSVFQRSYKRPMSRRILNSHNFLSESFYLTPPKIKPAVVKFVCNHQNKISNRGLDWRRERNSNWTLILLILRNIVNQIFPVIYA